MKRRLFNIAAVISLLLCLGVIAVWVDSYWHFSRVGVALSSVSACISSDGGSINLSVERELRGGLFSRAPRAPAFLTVRGRIGDRYDEKEMLASLIELIETDKKLGSHGEVEMRTSWHGFGASSEDGFGPRLRGTPPDSLPPDHHVWHLCVPAWLLVAMTLMLPAVWMIDHRKRRRRVIENHCEKCGYDLRATPDRCPECGSVSGGAE
jgi:hypothetical protein